MRDSLTLDRSHRLCLKQMQGLHIRSRTDSALVLICALPIQAEIEKRKLTLIGQLCRLERDCATKQIFLLRLYSSYTSYLLRKYDLFYVLQDYV